MASIREVARVAGVSISTVSRVLNGNDRVAPHLRKQVLTAVDRCHYSTAPGRRSNDLIALVFAGPFTPGSPYDAACLEGLVEALRETSFDLTILDVRRDKLERESYRQFFARKGIGGAVVRCTAAERGLVEIMAEEGFPLVLLGDHYEAATRPCIYASSRQASVEAVEHLTSLAHRRIGFAACLRDDGDHLDRYGGYRDGMARRGLLDEDLVFRIPPDRVDGVQLLRKIMALPNPPTALYVADPRVAVGVINEAHHMGLEIPQQLSVVGFDDTDTRHSIFPKMTAVCQDSRQLGRAAFETLLQLMGEPSLAASAGERPAAWFEIHDTTGPAPTVVSRVLANRVRLPAVDAAGPIS